MSTSITSPVQWENYQASGGWETVFSTDEQITGQMDVVFDTVLSLSLSLSLAVCLSVWISLSHSLALFSFRESGDDGGGAHQHRHVMGL